MVKGIGTDIIEIERIKTAMERTGSFAKKIYTKQEEQILLKKANPVESAAGLFATKEAVSKALGTGFRTFGPSDIEIYYDDKGSPKVRLHEGAKKQADAMEVTNIFVSISHCQSYAVAMVVLEG